jgi:hypothetical protein
VIKRALLVATSALVAFAPSAGAPAAAADGIPSGQRVLGQSVVEPVYDAERAGAVGFISTPVNAPLEADPRAWAPLYLPVYPDGSTVGALICPHVPVDTCPDHGPIIAGLAQSVAPDVYGAGVLGHDHVAVLRGAGFHVALEPIVVLFTSKRAADEHPVTAEAIAATIGRGDAITIPLPGAALHGAQVPSRLWTLATPLQ